MIASNRWAEYILLVCVSTGRDIYSLASYHCSLDSFLEQLPDFGIPKTAAIINAIWLTEPQWAIVEDSYRNAGRVMEA